MRNMQVISFLDLIVTVENRLENSVETDVSWVSNYIDSYNRELWIIDLDDLGIWKDPAIFILRGQCSYYSRIPLKN